MAPGASNYGLASLREDYLNQVQRDFLSRLAAVSGKTTPLAKWQDEPASGTL